MQLENCTFCTNTSPIACHIPHPSLSLSMSVHVISPTPLSLSPCLSMSYPPHLSLSPCLSRSYPPHLSLSLTWTVHVISPRGGGGSLSLHVCPCHIPHPSLSLHVMSMSYPPPPSLSLTWTVHGHRERHLSLSLSPWTVHVISPTPLSLSDMDCPWRYPPPLWGISPWTVHGDIPHLWGISHLHVMSMSYPPHLSLSLHGLSMVISPTERSLSLTWTVHGDIPHTSLSL